MTTICIIGVYFGAFPEYFDLWLKSAEYNDTIDFIIFTDQQRENLPCNVKFKKCSLNSLRQLAEKKLGFEICLERPYKCCDLKPAYGFIFSDYISKYDYWGHCDFDLIWGDIRTFIESKKIDKYEKFLSLGHLSLYKNSEENRKRFMDYGSEVGDYRTVFQDEHNYAFDETSGVYQIYKKNNIPMFEERIFADISKIYRRFRLALDDINYDYQVFYWKNGHIYRAYWDNSEVKTEEFMYIHFKERKKMKNNNVDMNTSMFFITPSGFWDGHAKELSKYDMLKMNPFPGRKKEQEELNRYEKNVRIDILKKKIQKIFHIKGRIR